MRFLFDIQHPAFVHFFKPLFERMQLDGHSILIAAREKDVTLELLDSLDVPYVSISRAAQGRFGLASELIIRTRRLVQQCRQFRPHAILAVAGPSAGLAAALLRIPAVMLDEAEYATLQRLFALPFAKKVFTGTGYLKDLGSRQVRFRGVWVQSYVGPRYFRPDGEYLKRYGVDPEKPYTVLRMVSWGASHDVGKHGISQEHVHRNVSQLARFGDVYVSSERPLPENLQEHRCPVPIEGMHHLLAFARAYMGESTTMAAEAAVLGTPAVYCGPLRWGYLLAMSNEYGLIKIRDTVEDATAATIELLRDPESNQRWQVISQRLNQESDDLAELMYSCAMQCAERKIK